MTTQRVYRVYFDYCRKGKPPVEGDVMVLATSEREAKEAFWATHPQGNTFDYVVHAVETV